MNHAHKDPRRAERFGSQALNLAQDFNPDSHILVHAKDLEKTKPHGIYTPSPKILGEKGMMNKRLGENEKEGNAFSCSFSPGG